MFIPVGSIVSHPIPKLRASAEGRNDYDASVAPPASPERAAFTRAGVDGHPRRWTAEGHKSWVWLIAICRLLFADCQRSDGNSTPEG